MKQKDLDEIIEKKKKKQINYDTNFVSPQISNGPLYWISRNDLVFIQDVLWN